jgi:hypothetical protein
LAHKKTFIRALNFLARQGACITGASKVGVPLSVSYKILQSFLQVSTL